MLFGHDEQGNEQRLMLVDADGSAINDRIAELVGRQVEARGDIVRRDGLDYLYVSSVEEP